MSLTTHTVLAVRANLNAPSTQKKAACSSPTIKERITDLKKSICELTSERKRLKALHRKQTTEAERYYNKAQQAMKLNHESLARKLLIQRHDLIGFTSSLTSRLEYIEQTLPTLKETLLKLDPKAEPFLANPNEVEPRRCVTWVYPPVVEAVLDNTCPGGSPA